MRYLQPHTKAGGEGQYSIGPLPKSPRSSRDDGGAQKTMQGNVSTLCSATLKRSLPPQSSFIVPTDDLEWKKEWPRHPNASRPPDRF
jgi:hypothetical protein